MKFNILFWIRTINFSPTLFSIFRFCFLLWKRWSLFLCENSVSGSCSLLKLYLFWILCKLLYNLLAKCWIFWYLNVKKCLVESCLAFVFHIGESYIHFFGSTINMTSLLPLLMRNWNFRVLSTNWFNAYNNKWKNSIQRSYFYGENPPITIQNNRY